MLRAFILVPMKKLNGEDYEHRGTDLLSGRRFKRVDSAVTFCDDKLLKAWKLIDPPQIQYVVDDPDGPIPEPEPTVAGGAIGAHVLYTGVDGRQFIGKVERLTPKGRVVVSAYKSGLGRVLPTPISITTIPARLKGHVGSRPLTEDTCDFAGCWCRL